MLFRKKKTGLLGCFISIIFMLCFAMLLSFNNADALEVPDDFPRFIVPRQQKRFNSLREMFWLHYPRCGPQPTLWDEWMVSPALWPAFGADNDNLAFHRRWKQCLESRVIDDEGYVSSHQHASIAHPLGWPFPAWVHGKGGAGWHFSFQHTAPPPFRHDEISTCTQWILEGIRDKGIDKKGWNIVLENINASLITPECEIDPVQAPFLQLRWSAESLGNVQPYVEWRTREDPEFDPDRRMYFEPVNSSDTIFSLIPVYKHPRWSETITGLRLCFANEETGISVNIQAFFTTYDTRHNVNNQSYISGCTSYFWWTRDLDFLRNNINRMRQALHYLMTEHNALQEKAIHTTWQGHNGRSGLQRDSEGGKIVKSGVGIGNNYWDLLPFGGKDAYATIRYYSTLNKMAALEEEIRNHPEWTIPYGYPAFSPEELALHAREVKETGNRIFWNPAAMRFTSGIDDRGEKHDYGFTFLNLEAVHYDFATQEHAKAIMDWICGERVVAEDTSLGEDIYHWVFAPRATTLRNTEYYYWAWSSPESIPWGGQVQDGGAVFGFSYHDLMARLKIKGVENSWERLKEIIDWFDEVREAGGYRAFYDGKREGTLQGGGTAGGLGLDHEFTESALVPQIVLDGFLGFAPRGDGFYIDPRFPKEWQEIAIESILFHGIILEIKATTNSVKVTRKSEFQESIYIRLPRGGWKVIFISENGISSRIKPVKKRAADGTAEVEWSNEASVILIRDN